MKTWTLRALAAGHVASAASVILTAVWRGDDPVPWDAVLVALVGVMGAGAAMLIVLTLAARTLDPWSRVVFVNLAVGLCLGAFATITARPLALALGITSLALAATSVTGMFVRRLGHDPTPYSRSAEPTADPEEEP